MPRPASPAFETARFRRGGAYELVVYDRLPDEEKSAFGELLADPGFYGVLRPVDGSGRTYRAANRETALLLLTLGEPGTLPFFARGSDSADGIAALVYDGVLEVEHDGRFLTGPEAAPVLSDARRAPAGHPLTRLSHDALRLAAAAGGGRPDELASLLYDFNRLPVPREWAVRLPDREAVLAWLGYPAGSAPRRRLEAGWEVGDGGERSRGWIYFTGRRRGGRPAGASYKLYVSPAVEELPRAVEAVAAVLEGRSQATFKTGADAAGLFRPDKLVAYFADLDALLAAARALEERLDGVAAHGVPFTAPIDDTGLLSWGADPPASERPLSWHGPESWRTWLAGRLGSALAQAAGGDPDAACSFALDRLAREGVDVDRWIPAAGLFRAA